MIFAKNFAENFEKNFARNFAKNFARNYEKKNTWNIRRLVNEKILPSTQ